MSAETTVSTNVMAQVYRGEVKLLKLNSLRRSLRTAPFFPMPNIKLGFCFEISYKHHHRYEEFLLIKLKLLALCAYDLPKTMKLRLQVDLNYMDGTVFQRYKLLPALTTDEMISVVFDDLIYSGNIPMKFNNQNKDSLIIQCEMEFFDHIFFPLAYNKFNSFAANCKSLSKFGKFGDISIKIGEKYLLAHKDVLVKHSSVFKNMLSHGFKESTITITDSTLEVFECFLKYLYSGEVEDKSWPSAKVLYALADKYDVLSLKQLTGEIISSQLSLGNVCEILNLAFDYNDDVIKTKAVSFAAVHLRELLPTNEWKEFVARHPLAGYEAALSYVL